MHHINVVASSLSECVKRRKSYCTPPTTPDLTRGTSSKLRGSLVLASWYSHLVGIPTRGRNLHIRWMYIKPIWHRNSRCNYNNTEFILAGDFPVYTGQPILVYVSMRNGADTLTQDFFRAPAAGWTPSHATSQAKMLPCVPESLCQRVSNMFPSVLESLCQCVYSPFPFLTMSLRCDSTSLGASLASRQCEARSFDAFACHCSRLSLLKSHPQLLRERVENCAAKFPATVS